MCYKDGSSAFMRASALGDLAVLGALHAAGADVNGCDRAGATALHLAARMVRLETLRFLRPGECVFSSSFSSFSFFCFL